MGVKIKINRAGVNRAAMIGISLALESFAVNVWSTARKICPVDTGSLRNSIRVERSSGLNRNYTMYRIKAGAGEVEGSGMKTIGGSNTGVGVGIQKGIGKGKYRNPTYALFVELGTVKMAAQPFMRPAFNKHKNSLRSTIRRFIKVRF